MHKLQSMSGNAKSAFNSILAFGTASGVCIRRMLSRHLDLTEVQCNYITCEPCGICSTHSTTEKLQANAPVQDDADYFGGLEEEIYTDFTFGQGLVNNQKHLGQELWYHVTAFTKTCILCYVAKDIKVCHPKACNILYKLCYRCLSDSHKSFECQITPKRVQGTCAYCLLPVSLGGTMFHPEGFTTDCKFKDVLKTFGKAVLKYGKIKNEEWLYEYDTTGNLNLWNFFVQCCNGNLYACSLG